MKTSRRFGSGDTNHRQLQRGRSLATRLIALLTALGLTLMSTANSWAQLPFDVIAPTIAHNVAERPGLAGDPQAITATVTDNDSVQTVTLFHRSDSNYVFNQTPMMPTGENIWLATIDSDLTDRIEYYLTATDAQGNRVQKGTADNPLVLRLLVPEPTLVTAESPPASTVAATTPITDDDLANTAVQPNWLWIGLGILAVGALVGASGSGGGGSAGEPDPPTTCCTVTFTAPNASGN